MPTVYDQNQIWFKCLAHKVSVQKNSKCRPLIYHLFLCNVTVMQDKKIKQEKEIWILVENLILSGLDFDLFTSVLHH